jgi:hypothetical protein
MDRELAVVVRVDTAADASATVSGRLESPYGGHRFVGWLDLLGQLEAVIDRAMRSPGGVDDARDVRG